MNLQELHIDKSWTLFLDRDGVINKKIDDGYVLSTGMFEWIDGSSEAIVSLSKIFGRIIIVTNQQGIGKGLMSESDLSAIHNVINMEVQKAGGKIDAFYFSPNLKDENNNMRKPGTGMPLQAKVDFPEIDFQKSIMVGDSKGDMEMADKLGMKKIFIDVNKYDYFNADYVFKSLKKFSLSMNKF